MTGVSVGLSSPLAIRNFEVASLELLRRTAGWPEVPWGRCSGVRRSRPQADNELVISADSGDRIFRLAATPMEINRYMGFR